MTLDQYFLCLEKDKEGRLSPGQYMAAEFIHSQYLERRGIPTQQQMHLLCAARWKTAEINFFFSVRVREATTGLANETREPGAGPGQGEQGALVCAAG